MTTCSYHFTDQELISDAARFSTKRDWRLAGVQSAAAGGYSAYRAACRRGSQFFNECTRHMARAKPLGRKMPNYRYSDEELANSAADYKHIVDWKRAKPRLYHTASRRARKSTEWKAEWWPKITGHMEVWSSAIYDVYAYEFSDDTVYVGLTKYPDKRHNNEARGHRVDGPVFWHREQSGLEPVLRNLRTGLTDRQAGELETAEIERYRQEGWNVLNTNKGGSLGSVRFKRSEQELIDSAAKFKTRAEYLAGDQHGYKSAKRRGIFDQCVAHMPGEFELSTARCKAPRPTISDETRSKMSLSAQKRHQSDQSVSNSGVLKCHSDSEKSTNINIITTPPMDSNKNSITVIIVGASPVGLADETASRTALEQNATYLSQAETGNNWMAIDAKISVGKAGSAFVVTSAIPENMTRRLIEGGYTVKLVDGGASPAVSRGAANNYNCSFRAAQRLIGERPPLKHRVQTVARTWSIYHLVDASGAPMYVGQTGREDNRYLTHVERVNSVVSSGDIEHHRRALYIALARSFDRMVTKEDIIRGQPGVFDSEDSAKAAEVREINALSEKGVRLYNKQHNPAPASHEVQGLETALTDVTEQVVSTLTELGLYNPVGPLPLKLRNLAVGSISAGCTDLIATVNTVRSARRAQPAVIKWADQTWVFSKTGVEFMAEFNRLFSV